MNTNLLFTMRNFVRRFVLVFVAFATGLVGVYAQRSSSRSFSVSWSEGESSVYELLGRKPHEVKFNLFSTTLLLRPELSYDYTINPEVSVGSRLAFGFDTETGDALGRFQLSPYVRWHFYKETRGNALRGFFVEANMAYTNYDGTKTHMNEREVSESRVSAFGVGIGLGYRWITRRAWTFELGGVLGRNIVSPNAPSVYGNYVFSIGKRF